MFAQGTGRDGFSLSGAGFYDKCSKLLSPRVAMSGPGIRRDASGSAVSGCRGRFFGVFSIELSFFRVCSQVFRLAVFSARGSPLYVLSDL